MASVESFDITGKHPEAEQYEKELHEKNDQLFHMLSVLDAKYDEDLLASIRGETSENPEVKAYVKNIEALKVRIEEIQNELFRIRPEREGK